MVTLQKKTAEDGLAFARTGDGRQWGPFDSAFAAQAWEKWFADSHGSLFTAREVYEGSVHGDGYYLVSPMAIEFGTHPFTEIYDWGIDSDNGRVVADLPSGMTLLDPETPVLVSGAVKQQPSRRLPPPGVPPREADMRHPAEASFPSRDRGEIVVLDDLEAGGWLVAWRADGRVTRRLPVLSLHGSPECARHAARKAAREFVPPPARKSTRPRDGQRERVYRWEHSFRHERVRFGSIDECRAFVEETCSSMGLKPPEVLEGRYSLENHSYFSGLKGIVVQKDMMDSHTLLHETAHYAVYASHAAREASHGPRFAGTLAGMLAAFAGADLDEALRKADETGVEVDRAAAEEYAAFLRPRAYG